MAISHPLTRSTLRRQPATHCLLKGSQQYSTIGTINLALVLLVINFVVLVDSVSAISEQEMGSVGVVHGFNEAGTHSRPQHTAGLRATSSNPKRNDDMPSGSIFERIWPSRSDLSLDRTEDSSAGPKPDGLIEPLHPSNTPIAAKERRLQVSVSPTPSSTTGASASMTPSPSATPTPTAAIADSDLWNASLVEVLSNGSNAMRPSTAGEGYGYSVGSIRYGGVVALVSTLQMVELPFDDSFYQSGYGIPNFFGDGNEGNGFPGGDDFEVPFQRRLGLDFDHSTDRETQSPHDASADSAAGGEAWSPFRDRHLNGIITYTTKLYMTPVNRSSGLAIGPTSEIEPGITPNLGFSVVPANSLFGHVVVGIGAGSEISDKPGQFCTVFAAGMPLYDDEIEGIQRAGAFSLVRVCEEAAAGLLVVDDAASYSVQAVRDAGVLLSSDSSYIGVAMSYWDVGKILYVGAPGANGGDGAVLAFPVDGHNVSIGAGSQAIPGTPLQGKRFGIVLAPHVGTIWDDVSSEFLPVIALASQPDAISLKLSLVLMNRTGLASVRSQELSYTFLGPQVAQGLPQAEFLCFRSLEMQDLTNDGQEELIVACEGELLVAVALNPSNISEAMEIHVIAQPTQLVNSTGHAQSVAPSPQFGIGLFSFQSVDSSEVGIRKSFLAMPNYDEAEVSVLRLDVPLASPSPSASASASPTPSTTPSLSPTPSPSPAAAGVVVRSAVIRDGQGGLPAGVHEGWDYFGDGATCLGDLDGDAIPDLAIGAPGTDSPITTDVAIGSVFVFFMQRDGSARDFVEISANTSSGFNETYEDMADGAFGTDLASMYQPAGDDGHVLRLVVGEPEFDHPSVVNAGRIWMLRLNTHGQVVHAQTIGPSFGGMDVSVFSPADLFGGGLAPLGDVNGDSFNDIAVGAVGYDSNGVSSGGVFVLMLGGDDTVLSFTTISRAPGEGLGSIPDSYTFMGRQVVELTPAGDSPGPVDLALGAPNSDAVLLLPINSTGQPAGNASIVRDGQGGMPSGSIPAQSEFGYRMESCGDMNGDGFEDLAVGAYADATDGHNRGSLYILYLNRSAATSSPVVYYTRIGSGTANVGTAVVTSAMRFGSGIARLGDLDGDGTVDLAVGGRSGGTQFAGSVVVLFMGGSPPSSSPSPSVTPSVSPTPSSSSSTTASSTPTPSVTASPSGTPTPSVTASPSGTPTPSVTASPSGTPTPSVTASPSGTPTPSVTASPSGTPTPSVTASCSPTPSSSSSASSTPSVSASPAAPGEVLGTVILGSDSGGLPSSVTSTNGAFGSSITSLGDLNFDGVPDIAVSSEGDTLSDPGQVTVILLASNGTSKRVSFIGESSGDLNLGSVSTASLLGARLSVMRQPNGETPEQPRLLVGQPNAGSAHPAGRLWIVRLKPDGHRASFTTIGQGGEGGLDIFTSAASALGGCVSGEIGDVDGDGLNDILLGAPGFQSLHVLFMLANDTVRSTTRLSLATGEGFDILGLPTAGLGTAVAVLPSFDGNGPVDLVAGAQGSDAILLAPLSADGIVRGDVTVTVIQDGAGGMPTSSVESGSLFGYAVQQVPDMNGDGESELAVGAILDDDGGSARGVVYLLFLDRSNTTTEPVSSYSVIGSSTTGYLSRVVVDGDAFGAAIAIPGDVDGDGRNDMAIGRPGASVGGSFKGGMNIVFLSGAFPSASPSVTPTSSASPSSSVTPSPSNTATPTVVQQPSSTSSPTPSDSPTPSATSVATASPSSAPPIIIAPDIDANTYLIDYCDSRLSLSAEDTVEVSGGSRLGLRFEWTVRISPASPSSGSTVFQAAISRLQAALHGLAAIEAFSSQDSLSIPLVPEATASSMNAEALAALSSSSLAIPRVGLRERVVLDVLVRVRDASISFNPTAPLIGVTTDENVAQLSVTSIGVPRPVLTPQNTSSVVAARTQALSLGPQASLCGTASVVAPAGARLALAFDWLQLASIQSSELSAGPSRLVVAGSDGLSPLIEARARSDVTFFLTGEQDELGLASPSPTPVPTTSSTPSATLTPSASPTSSSSVSPSMSSTSSPSTSPSETPSASPSTSQPVLIDLDDEEMPRFDDFYEIPFTDDFGNFPPPMMDDPAFGMRRQLWSAADIDRNAQTVPIPKPAAGSSTKSTCCASASAGSDCSSRAFGRRRRLASIQSSAPYAKLDTSIATSSVEALGGRQRAHDVSNMGWFLELSSSVASGSTSPRTLGLAGLLIPSGALRVNHAYLFAVRATPVLVSSSGEVSTVIQDGPELAEGWSIVSVGVRRSQLQLGITGGDRTVTSEAGFSLGVSSGRASSTGIDPDFDVTGAAIDPGYDSALTEPIQVFQWSCLATPSGGTLMSSCLHLVPGGGNRTDTQLVNISPEETMPYIGQRLELKLNVSTGLVSSSRRRRTQASLATIDEATLVTGSSIALVTVALPGLPSVEVNALRTRAARLASVGGATVISSSVKVVLDAIINDVVPQDAVISVAEEGLTIQWRQLSGPAVPGVPQVDGTSAVSQATAVLTSATARSMVLRAGVLKPGETYVFQVVSSLAGASAAVLASGDASVSADVTLFVNQPPSSGAIILQRTILDSTEAPKALVEPVQILTTGWTDSIDDFPLRFAFYVDTLGTTVESIAGAAAATEAEIAALLARTTVVPLRGANLESELTTILPPGQTVAGGPAVNMTLIATARDPSNSVGMAAARILVAPALDRDEVQNASVVTSAAADRLSEARDSATSRNPTQTLVLVGASAELLNELDTNDTSAQEEEQQIRGQLLDLVATVAGELEVSGENLQLAAQATTSALAKTNQTTTSQLGAALNATEQLLSRRLQEADSDEALDDGPAASLLTSLRVTSDAGSALAGGDSVVGGERLSNTSGLLGRAILRGVIPGEDQKVLVSEDAEGSGMSLTMVAGRLDVLGLDSANLSRVKGGATVLGLVALGGGKSGDLQSVAELYCNRQAGTLDDTSDLSESDRSSNATFGVALVGADSGGLRRALQDLQQSGLLGGVDATALEWKSGASTADSIHPTEFVDLSSTLGVGGTDENATNGVAIEQSGALYVEANRTSTSITESLSGELGTTVTIKMASATSGGAIQFSSQGLEVCVFVPSAPTPSVPDALTGLDVPVVVLSGDTEPDFPNPTVNDSDIFLDLPQSCADGVAENQTKQMFEAQQGVQAAACIFWDEDRQGWSGAGCQAVALLDGGTVCRCSHLTDFASRIELLLQSNREVFAVGSRPITTDDILTNPETFIAIGAMTLGVLVAAVGTLWIEDRDRVRFSRRLVKDPEIAIVREIVRLEGTSELLNKSLLEWKQVRSNTELSEKEEGAADKKLDRALIVAVKAMRAIAGEVEEHSDHTGTTTHRRSGDTTPRATNSSQRGAHSTSRRGSSMSGKSGRSPRRGGKDSRGKVRHGLPAFEAHIPGARMFLEQELLARTSDIMERMSRRTACYCCYMWCCSSRDTSLEQDAGRSEQSVASSGHLLAAGNNLGGMYRGVVDESRVENDAVGTHHPGSINSPRRDRVQRATDRGAAVRGPPKPLVQGAYDEDLSSMSPCYRAWVLRWDLLKLWCARLPYEHVCISAFLRFNYQQDRIMRLGQLLAVIFVGMFTTAFFYSVSGADYTGIDEDCDGEDDFVPLAIWEQAVFAIAASVIQLPASVLLTVLFGMSGDACFLWRYFPIWRELELRSVAEVHLGSKVGELRRKLQVLQTSLANWLETTEGHVGSEDLDQLRMVGELLGDEGTESLIDEVMEGRRCLGREHLRQAYITAPDMSESGVASPTMLSPMRKLRRMGGMQTPGPRKAAEEQANTSNMFDGFKPGSVALAPPPSMESISPRKINRTTEVRKARSRRNAIRLQLIRALRDYGDFLALGSRNELSCIGFTWSCRFRELPCWLDQERSRVQVQHERRVAALTAHLAKAKQQGVKEDVELAHALARRALQEVEDPSNSPNVFWFLPVQTLPNMFNPVALGWVKSPATCRRCCPCIVWCCNRLPVQKPLFLIRQMASDGRPYGCCHTRRDMRLDPTKKWIEVVRADEDANGIHTSVQGSEAAGLSGIDVTVAASPATHGIVTTDPNLPTPKPQGYGKRISSNASIQVAMVLPGGKSRQAQEALRLCAWCDCCECGPLDPLRCVCAIERPPQRGTADIQAEQQDARLDELLVALNTEQGRNALLSSDTVKTDTADVDSAAATLDESRVAASRVERSGSLDESEEEGLPADPLTRRLDALYGKHRDDARVQADIDSLGEEAAMVRQRHQRSLDVVLQREPSLGDPEGDPDNEGDQKDSASELDTKLRQTVAEFDNLSESEKEDYRAAYGILMHHSQKRRVGESYGSQMSNGAMTTRSDKQSPSTGQTTSSVQHLLTEMLSDEGMQSAVRGTLLEEGGARSKALLYSSVSFVLLATVLAFVLWFIMAFGLTRGRKVISSFMVTFWISQAVTFLVTQPLVVFAAIAWATTFGPSVGRQCSWMPLCGASDEAQAFSGSRVLSGRVENVAMLHAVGATAGLSARDSLLVFSLSSALSAAFASDFVGSKQRSDRYAIRSSRKPDSGEIDSEGDAEDALVADATKQNLSPSKDVRRSKRDGARDEISARSRAENARRRRKASEKRQQAVFYRMERRLHDTLTREFARFRFRTAVEGLRRAAQGIVESTGSGLAEEATSSVGESAAVVDDLHEAHHSPRSDSSHRAGGAIPGFGPSRNLMSGSALNLLSARSVDTVPDDDVRSPSRPNGFSNHERRRALRCRDRMQRAAAVLRLLGSAVQRQKQRLRQEVQGALEGIEQYFAQLKTINSLKHSLPQITTRIQRDELQLNLTLATLSRELDLGHC